MNEYVKNHFHMRTTENCIPRKERKLKLGAFVGGWISKVAMLRKTAKTRRKGWFSHESYFDGNRKGREKSKRSCNITQLLELGAHRRHACLSLTFYRCGN